VIYYKSSISLEENSLPDILNAKEMTCQVFYYLGKYR